MKKKRKKRSADFCADQIDVITNFAAITNVVVKRVMSSVRIDDVSGHMKYCRIAYGITR